MGRPDGRLSALTTSENSVCLSTSQASSIQSIGLTLESITIGHTPSKMGLTKEAVFLKGKRKDFYCEVALKKDLDCVTLDGRSPGMLLGDYHNLRKRCLGNGDQEDGIMERLAMITGHKVVSKEEMSERRRLAIEERVRAFALVRCQI